MSAPSTDRAAVRKALQALYLAGYEFIDCQFGDDPEHVDTVDQALEHVMSVDDCFVTVRLSDGSEGWVRFVLGNEPFEVICDYHLALEPVLGPLTEGWQQ